MLAEIIISTAAAAIFIGLCQALLCAPSRDDKAIWTSLLLAHTVVLYTTMANSLGRGVAHQLAFPCLDILLNTLVNAWLVPIERLRSQHDKRFNKKEAETRSVWWALRLMFSFRGPGWQWQVKGIPTGWPVGYSRFRFVLEVLVETLVCLMVNDMCRGAMAVIVMGGFHDQVQQHCLPLLYWVASRSGLDMMYLLTVGFCVLLKLADPSECPPFFGNVGDAFTVRNFWGRVYHQKLRHWLQESNKALVLQLGLAPGSIGSKYGQLVLGFLASGLYHDLAYAFGYTFRPTYTKIYGSVALWIIAEDVIIAAGQRLRLDQLLHKAMIRGMGYIWTLTCLSCLGTSLLVAGKDTHTGIELGLNTYTWSFSQWLKTGAHSQGHGSTNKYIDTGVPPSTI